MPPTSMEHGEISSNVLHHLGLHVFEHQLGRSYTAGTTFHLGDRVVSQMLPLFRQSDYRKIETRGHPYRLTWQ